jgi:uncharacterized protein involved in tolerance to divalent cations
VDELVQAFVKSYGIVGLIIIAPVVGMVYLWRENIKLNTEMRVMAAEYAKRIDEMGQRVVAAQEKRVDDSHNITTQLVDMISEHSGAQKETNLALDRIGDMVSDLMRNK